MNEDDFLLFVPGPAEIHEEIRQVGSRRLPYMRTPSFSELHRRVVAGLQKLLGTKGDVLLFTASGTGVMEASILSLFVPGEKVVVVNGGTFGTRWKQLASLHGLKVDEIALEPGRDLSIAKLQEHLDEKVAGVLINHHETSTGHLYDIEAIGTELKDSNALFVVDAIGSLGADPYRMDAWGVDATVFSTQKGLALPPGMAFLGLNQRAADKAVKTPKRSYYFHAADYLDNSKRGQAPFTIAVGIMLQLEARVKAIGETGIDKLVEEHAGRAAYFREGIADLPVTQLPDRPSNAATALKVDTSRHNAFEIVREIENRYGIYVAPNAPPLNESIFRVGHFGYQPVEHLDRLIRALHEVFERGERS